MWDCDLNNGIYISPDTHGTTAGQYLVSALAYPKGFEMEFTYEFIRRGDEYGYVQGQAQTLLNSNGTYDKKLSFICNSGIKIGGTGSDIKREVAILDVEMMVAMVGGLDNFLEGIKLQGNIPIVEINGYRSEELARLMHGIKYNHSVAEYVNIQTVIFPVDSDGNNEIDSDELLAYHKALFTENYNLFSGNCGTMKIIWELNSIGSTTGTLEVLVNDNLYYLDTNIPIGNAHLYIQSHWGSGVKFSDVTLRNQV